MRLCWKVLLYSFQHGWIIFFLSVGFSYASPLETKKSPSQKISKERITKRPPSQVYLQARHEILNNTARALALHKKHYWHLLLRYEGGVSQADSDRFFFAKSGKNNPEEELQANLRAFFGPWGNKKYKRNQHPQCRFPARYTWLKQQFKIEQDPTQAECPGLSFWFQMFNYQSVSLVFASYYLNSPSSLFGHPLLKVKTSNYNNASLLDHSISFAAHPGRVDIFRYVLYALFGGHPGYYYFLPYHVKVREYNDMENRDLWEYELNLSQIETQRMLLHVWEMDQTHFDYFYLKENCAYHLLTLLEVARPSLELRKDHSFLALPSETIKTIVRNKLVEKIHYRPSTQTELNQRIASLNEREKSLLSRLSYANKDFDLLIKEFPEINKQRQAFVLDIFLSAMRQNRDTLSKSELKKDESKKMLAHYKKLLQVRLEYPSNKNKFPILKDKISPHLSHSPILLGIAGGTSSYGGFISARWHWLYHDLLARDDGFPANSELIVFSIDLRQYENTKKPVFENTTFLRMLTIKPLRFTLLNKNSFSYGFHIGSDVEYIKRNTTQNTSSSKASDKLKRNQNIFANVLGGFAWEWEKNKNVILTYALLGGVRYR